MIVSGARFSVEVTRSLVPLTRCVLALAPLIRLVKTEKRPVLSGVSCVVVCCRVLCAVVCCCVCVCAEKHKKTEQKVNKRWTHGDNSVGKYKKRKKHLETCQNTDSVFGTVWSWSSMDTENVRVWAHVC